MKSRILRYNITQRNQEQVSTNFAALVAFMARGFRNGFAGGQMFRAVSTMKHAAPNASSRRSFLNKADVPRLWEESGV